MTKTTSYAINIAIKVFFVFCFVSFSKNTRMRLGFVV
jgi:hypothetical protein